MASGTVESSPGDAQAGTSAGSGTKFVEFDEFIDYQLARTRKGIRSADLLAAAAVAALAVALYVFLFVLADHWLFEHGVSQTARWIGFSIIVTAVAGWFLWRLAQPLLNRVTRLFAAKEIERAQPELRQSLLTLVDVKQSERDINPRIVQALEKRTAVALSNADLEQAVDRKLVTRAAYAAMALVALLCVYALASPKSLMASVGRAIAPFADISAPTRTRIDSVTPGDAEVYARTDFDIEAEISGQAPDEVVAFVTTDDRSLVDERVEMTRPEEGVPIYEARFSGVRGEGLLQSFRYRVEAGDAASEEYRVHVLQPPSATVQDVTYRPPTYMRLPERTETAADLIGWDGSEVVLRARTNVPVKYATVVFSDTRDIPAAAEEVGMDVGDGRNLTAKLRLRFRSDGTAPAFYAIRVRTESGETDPSPQVHTVKVRRDKPPVVELKSPTRDFETTADSSVPIRFEAADPDFMLSAVRLRLAKGDDELPASPRLMTAPPERQRVEGQHRLELSDYRVEVGDTLTFWVEARDNRNPNPNGATSDRVTVTVIDPPPEPGQEPQARDQRQAPNEAQRPRDRQQNPAQNDQPQNASKNRRPADEHADNAGREEQRGQEAGEAAEDGQTADDGQTGEAGEMRRERGPEDGGDNRDLRDQEFGEREQNQGQEGEGENRNGENNQDQGDSAEQEMQARERAPDGSGRRGRQESGEGESNNGSDGADSEDGKAPFDEALRRLIEREREEQEQRQQQQENSDRPREQNSDSPRENTEQQNRQQQGDQQQNGQQQQGSSETDVPSGTDGQNVPNDEMTEPNGADPTDQPPQAGQQDGSGSSGGDSPNDPNAGNGPEQQPGQGAAPDERSDQSGRSQSGTNEPDQQLMDEQSTPPPSQNDRPGQGEPPRPRQQPDAGPLNDGQNSQQPEQGAQSGDRNQPGQDGRPEAGQPRDNDQAGEGEPQDERNQPGQGSEGEADTGRPEMNRPEEGEQPGYEPRRDQDNQPGDATQPGESQENVGGEPSDRDGQQAPQQPGQDNQPGQMQESGQQEPEQGDQPGDGEQPGQKGQPGPDQQPQQGDQPGKQQQPGQGDQPADGQEPPQGNQSGDGQQPGQGDQPGDGQQPGQGDQPGDGQQPGEGMQPGEGQQPSQGNQPGEGRQRGRGNQPGEGMQSGEGQQPGQGNQPGEGQQPGQGNQPGDGQQPGQGNQPGDGQQPGRGNQSGDGQQPRQGRQGGGDRPGNGGTRGGNPNGEPARNANGEDALSPETLPDPADPDFAREASNLVHRRLRDELSRGEVDRELLDEMGYTEADLRRFADQLEQRLNESGAVESPQDAARRRQFDSILDGINREAQSTRRAAGDGPRRAADGFNAPRREAPPEYRSIERAYRERLLRKGR